MPKIHIWDIHTLKTVHILEGDHKSDIYLLEFTKNDTHLVSCSLRSNTPIIVHDIEKNVVVFTYYVDDFLMQIVPIVIIDEKNIENRYIHKNFLLVSKNKIFSIKQNELQSVLKLQNMQKFASLNEIT